MASASSAASELSGGGGALYPLISSQSDSLAAQSSISGSVIATPAGATFGNSSLGGDDIMGIVVPRNPKRPPTPPGDGPSSRRKSPSTRSVGSGGGGDLSEVALPVTNIIQGLPIVEALVIPNGVFTSESHSINTGQVESHRSDYVLPLVPDECDPHALLSNFMNQGDITVNSQQQTH